VDFVLLSGLVFMLIMYLFVCSVSVGSFMLRLEANGSTGEGAVAGKGFLSNEPWVRWGDAGRARRLPAPCPQCSQRGQAPAPSPAPAWPLMSTQAEEVSHLEDARSFPQRAQNGKGGRRSMEFTRRRSSESFPALIPEGTRIKLGFKALRKQMLYF